MNREILDDGDVAISVERLGVRYRLLPKVPDDSAMPPFCGIGSMTPLSASIARLDGFMGQMRHGHMMLIVRHLHAMKFSLIYIRRAEGRRMVGAKMIETGDWAGWWRIDIAEAMTGPLAIRVDALRAGRSRSPRTGP